jgi:hypothetical protein
MSDVAAVAGIGLEILPEDDLSIPEGWQLLTDESVEEPDGPITLEGIAIMETWVAGEKILGQEKRAGKRAGLRAAKALFRQQHLIPIKWRKKALFFAGTIVQDCYDYRSVIYLYWDSDQWCLEWSWLDDGFDSDDCAVRCSRK